MKILRRTISITLLICVFLSLCVCGSVAGVNIALAAEDTSAVSDSVEDNNRIDNETDAAKEAGDDSSTGENAIREGLNYFYALDGVAFDKEKAQECLMQASELGVPEANYYLGLLSLRSSDDSRFEKAKEYFKQSADQGCLLGLIGIGSLYENGQGVDRDYKKAKELYEEALENGCIEANAALAGLYRYAHGVKRDYNKALEYYTKALESKEIGYSRDVFSGIGDLYRNGLAGIQTDYATALDWYQRGVDANSPEALARMGDMYLNGYGVIRDYQQAMEYYKKAADLGSADAMCSIGILYLAGSGVERDNESARAWLLRSADEGSSDALYNLGNIARGMRTVKDEDFEKGLEYYSKAIDAGNISAYV